MEASDNRRGRRTTGTEIASNDKGPRRRVAKEAGRQPATSGKDQSRVLQSGPNQKAKALRTPKQRAAGDVAEDSARAGDLLEEARSRLEKQVAAGTERVAESLRRFGEQGVALASGRPQDAPDIGDYVRQTAENLLQAAQLADALADDVAVRGIDGFLGHIGGVARRRPGLLVLATATALFGAARTAPTAGPQGEGADEEDLARDRLEAAALDALLRALWPGDVDERSPAGRGQRSAGPGRLGQLAVRPKERMEPVEGRRAEAPGSVTGERAASAQESAKPVKKTATRAAREVKHGARARVQSGKGQTPEASDQVEEETAKAQPRIKAEARPPSGAGKNAGRAKGTAKSEPARTTRAPKAPLARSASTASSGPARRRAPARPSQQ